jgi:hypothetical protein
MRIKQTLVIAVFFLLSSCSNCISNFEKYQKQFAAKSTFMPSKEDLDGKLIKVVVFPLEENSIQIASQAQLGSSIADNVENILGAARIAQIVDRKGVAKLQKEVQLAEMKKTGAYKGPQVADYAISGTISNVTFNGDYSPSTIGYNPLSGQITNVPAKSNFVSTVTGNIKIYELPSMVVLQTIEFSAKRKVSENAQDQGGLNIAGIIKIGAKEVKIRDRDDGMVRRAGLEAVNDVQVEIKNALARRAYILEKRALGSKAIFKINLGSSDGIKDGAEFDVVGKYESQNEITNDTEIETRVIASGKVSSRIEPETAWIIINDKDQENQVRIGDVVKMKYKKGAFDWLTKILN